MKYKVKNFSNRVRSELQNDIKEWVESRDSIIIHELAIWSTDTSYATIIYVEVDYS